MFLEFGQAPKVNGTNLYDPNNEFSVFSLSSETADLQVSWAKHTTFGSFIQLETVLLKESLFAFNCLEVYPNCFGAGGGYLRSLDAFDPAHLPPAQAQENRQKS